MCAGNLECAAHLSRGDDLLRCLVIKGGYRVVSNVRGGGEPMHQDEGAQERRAQVNASSSNITNITYGSTTQSNLSYLYTDMPLSCVRMSVPKHNLSYAHT